MGPFEQQVKSLTEAGDVTKRLLTDIKSVPWGSEFRDLQNVKPGKAGITATETRVLNKIPDGGFDLGFYSKALVFSPELRKLVSSKAEHKALIKLFHRGLLRVENPYLPDQNRETYLILKV